MKNGHPKVYGIGNPLIDIIAQVTEEDLDNLGTHKGAMHLIDEQRRSTLLQHIQSKPLEYSCGGSCPNTIITLASLGIEATLAGKVGDDKFGTIYRKRVEELGVHNQLVVSEQPTGSSIILITPDSERTMNTYLGANRFFSASDIIEKSIAEADYFHFTGYMWDTQSQKSAIERALEIAHQAKTRITFDIADPFAVGRNRDDFLHLIANHVNVVFANNEEARILFNNYDAFECCKSMGKLCETAVVKNGKLGSFISHHQKLYQIPVQGPVTPVDTTGAGDIYAAGFLYGLCHQLSIEETGFIASYLAGEIIQQHGAQFSKEKALSVHSFLKQRKIRSNLV
ncbi:MAG: adenosine kinase [Sphaerochaetaceae bacterium]|nr:adenosine kinase [Sphaerochaetaceae bacterium]MDD4218684.1 adenosine kinase [Sphaerochaetaceae bacterium]MDY0371108.1 adenosine kinase [Sphaerochaetaceae bacterium]